MIDWHWLLSYDQCRLTCCPVCEQRSSAAVAWEAIKRIRVGIQHVCEANAWHLQREFGTLVWRESDDAEDFVNHIIRLAAELRQLGDNISDAEVVRKMLQVVPEHLSQVAISIETLLDVNTIAIEEVTGMLRAMEQWWKPALVLDNHGRLLLCQEKWMAKLNLHEFESKGGGSSSGAPAIRSTVHGAKAVDAAMALPHRRATAANLSLTMGRLERRTSASDVESLATGLEIAEASPKRRPTSRRPKKGSAHVANGVRNRHRHSAAQGRI
jgi:hypothetical protein